MLNSREGDTETKELACRLTEQDINARAQHLAELVEDRYKTDEERKEAAAVYRKEMQRLDEQIQSISEQVTTGSEMRDVQCTWKRFDDLGILALVREDIDQIVFQRPLNAEERQVQMFPAQAEDPVPS